MNLESLGWNNYFETQYEPFKSHGLTIGRVIKESRHIYQVYTEEGSIQAEISGSFHYTAIEKSDYPTVGDWVLMRMGDSMAIIEKVLERKTFFARKAPGNEIEQQIIASNIDHICIVAGLDGGRNFSLRGIERYITMVEEGGAQPAIILNKVDLCDDRDKIKSQILEVASNIPFFLVSALTGEGIEQFTDNFKSGETIAFTGPSGVGKSALLNYLMGNSIQKTGGQRDSDLRGKHTTTHKEMFFLTGGTLVIDTPGMREMQLYGNMDSLNDTFHEIYEAAKDCKFTDCTHQDEPGCAVKQLVTDGSLDEKRYENYLRMRGELIYLESKISEKGRMDKKKNEKNLSKLIKNYYKQK